MQSVQWIKLDTNIINDNKIEQLLRRPNGKRILLTWILLLCLAGRINKSGYFLMENEPYTIEMFTAPLKETESFLQKCFEIFLKFGLLGLEEGVYFIANWEKYQSSDRLDKIRENDRLKKQRQRARRKEMENFVPGDVPGDVPQENKNKIKNKKENILLYNPPNEWEQIIARYCAGLPESVRQETNCLLQTFLTSLKNQGKLLSPTGLSLTLEKLLPMAEASRLSPPEYLKEVLCRGWQHFYPIPEYQLPAPQNKASYSIEELEQYILHEERGIKQ